MTRVEDLNKLIAELRESGAEPEDIVQVAQELNMELIKERVKALEAVKGGGKVMRNRFLKYLKGNEFSK